MQLKNEARWLILIAVIGFVVYANSLGGEFVYDDKRQILRNPLIQETALAGEALTSDVWAFKGDGRVAASNYYRPTFVSWLLLNYRIFGPAPFGWHVLNLALHLAVCLLGYLLLRRWDLDQLTAFAVALVFAVHPVHSESVAWISGAPDLLFSLFLLSACWFAGQAAEMDRGSGSGRWLYLFLAALFYALALGSKEVGLLCFPLFYLIFSRSQAERATALRWTLPFFALAAAFFIARRFALGAISLPVEDAPGLSEALLSVPSMFVFYLRQLIFPLWLGANHPLRPVQGLNFLEFFAPLLIAAAAVVLLARLGRRSFVQKFGLALFTLTLAPALNAAAFPAEQIVHDRYLYLPLFGFLMTIFPSLAGLLEKTGREKARPVLTIMLVVIVLPLAVRTYLYNQVWRSETALWSHAVAFDPRSAFNWAQYGAVLSENGRLAEAFEAYRRSLAVRPTAAAYFGQARTLFAQNRIEETIADCRAVIALPPEKLNAYTLYQTYELYALALTAQNKPAEALNALAEARRRLPIYTAALTEKLAVVLYQTGDKAAALRELEAVKDAAKTELLPESKTVLLRLGMLYAESGRKADAKAMVDEYLRLTAKMQDNVTIADRRQAADLLRSLP
jgi:protein O-mannosyl-transferase